MSTTASTNMSLPIPGVGNESGPQWATDLNNCLTIIDQHDHTPGSGVQITPFAININSPLSFANNTLTNAQFLGMFLQTADPSTLGCLYYKGVDLYFNDGSSNHIRMTASGAVSGASGTITGLPSGTASASYQAGSATFVFQSATNTAATLDGRNLILRNSAASSHSLTISPPAAMGADISMTLPTIPASTLLLNMDSAGNMATVANASIADTLGAAMTSTGANPVAASRTRTTGATVAAGGVAISSSCGTFTSSAGSFVDVTNLTVTITTSGRPVFIGLMNDSLGTTSEILGIQNTGGISFTVNFRLQKGGVTVYTTSLREDGQANLSVYVPESSINYIDTSVNGVAGTYTYKLQASSGSASNTVGVVNSRLVAYEL